MTTVEASLWGWGVPAADVTVGGSPGFEGVTYCVVHVPAADKALRWVTGVTGKGDVMVIFLGYGSESHRMDRRSRKVHEIAGTDPLKAVAWINRKFRDDNIRHQQNWIMERLGAAIRMESWESPESGLAELEEAIAVARQRLAETG